MEEILNSIGLPTKYAEILVDNYIFTVEDLKIVDKADAIEIFKSDDLKTFLAWQKGGGLVEKPNIDKKGKRRKKSKGIMTDSFKPESNPKSNEKIEVSLPKITQTVTDIVSNPIHRNSDVPDFSFAPSLKANDKNAQETKSYENLKPNQIIESQFFKEN